MDYGLLFGAELVGTMLLTLFGNGVGYNVSGRNTTGSKGGYLMASFGWAMAVLIGVLVASAIGSKGHINPAVSIAVLTQGGITAEVAFTNIAGQLVGAFLGQCLVNIIYNKVMRELGTSSLGVHSCSPSHPNAIKTNLFTEFAATATLIIVAIYALSKVPTAQSYFGPLFASITILAIAVSLGGPTGYAINPARDAMPRLAYSLFHKLYRLEGGAFKTANWKYGWIPIVAPLASGAVIGAFLRLA